MLIESLVDDLEVLESACKIFLAALRLTFHSTEWINARDHIFDVASLPEGRVDEARREYRALVDDVRSRAEGIRNLALSATDKSRGIAEILKFGMENAGPFETSIRVRLRALQDSLIDIEPTRTPDSVIEELGAAMKELHNIQCMLMDVAIPFAYATVIGSQTSPANSTDAMLAKRPSLAHSFPFQDYDLTILVELAARGVLSKASELHGKSGMPPSYDRLVDRLRAMEQADPPLVVRPAGERSGYLITDAGRAELKRRSLFPT